jgi:MFS family permease
VGLLPDVLSSAELPRGNAMTTFCYGLGSIAGPFVPSLIMHVSVPQSLFAVAAALYVTVLLWMLRRPQKALCT